MCDKGTKKLMKKSESASAMIKFYEPPYCPAFHFMVSRVIEKSS